MNKAPDKPRKALGKGLSALLPTRPTQSPVQPDPAPGTRVGNIPISQIEPNPFNPVTSSIRDACRNLLTLYKQTG